MFDPPPLPPPLAAAGDALADGAAVAYPQVPADNMAAREIYRRPGLVDRHVYRYRTEPAGHAGAGSPRGADS